MAKTEYPPSPCIEERRTPYFEKIEQLLREDYVRFFRLGAAMMGNKQDGQDVVQEVLVNILARQDKPAAFIDDPVRYLCGAIIKKSHEFYRKETRRRIDYNVCVENIERSSVDPLADDPMIERLRRAMEILDPYWAEMLALRYAGELSVQEIADRYGRSRKAVEKALCKARKRTRQLMENPDAKHGRRGPSKVGAALEKTGQRIIEILNDDGSGK